MFQLLSSAYATVSIQNAAFFLGMNEEDGKNCKFICYFMLQL